jgi:hypothetical protein
MIRKLDIEQRRLAVAPEVSNAIAKVGVLRAPAGKILSGDALRIKNILWGKFWRR